MSVRFREGWPDFHMAHAVRQCIERAWCNGLCLYFGFLLEAQISPHMHMPLFAYRLNMKPVFKGLAFIWAEANGPVTMLMCSNYICLLRAD